MPFPGGEGKEEQREGGREKGEGGRERETVERGRKGEREGRKERGREEHNVPWAISNIEVYLSLCRGQSGSPPCLAQS